MVSPFLSVYFSQLIKELNNTKTPCLSIESLIEKIKLNTPGSSPISLASLRMKAYDDYADNKRQSSLDCSFEYYEQPFYLTGSRFFLGKTNTDWDFFTQYDEELIAHLKTVGFDVLYISWVHYPSDEFSLVKKVNYSDSDCLMVMRKKETEDFPQIDIQLVQHCQHRVLIRNTLYSLGSAFWKSITKEQASALWTRAHYLMLVPSPLELTPATNF